VTRSPTLTGPGTPEEIWQDCKELGALAIWTPAKPPSGRVMVIAPHPDDEILGAGGTVALLAAAGSEIWLVAVTDGENSHRGEQGRLRRVRPVESAAAARQLGVTLSETCRLEHPDGAVDEDRLAARLGPLVGPGDLVLAPWWHDGHPDHDRVGRAARAVALAASAHPMSYLVWAWHWASPNDGLPWSRACRVELGPLVARRKAAAVGCFQSQLAGPDPILSPPAVRRLTRRFEVFLAP
jgi:LmbE family N-acetylglucosaminyl deacetylase